MIKSEYIRNLNRNFERVLLENQPGCKRYQFCILVRGGIKYLLPCSYKQIDNNDYLYYDISSSQNVKQMFADKCVQRGWMKEFLWSIQKMRQELNRFLLDERNIIWSPEHIFQDLEKTDFLYLYIPYYGQNGGSEEQFDKLLEFWVDRVDYEDEALVEFVYHAYEQFMNVGQNYLEKQIFEDFKKMDEKKVEASVNIENKEPQPAIEKEAAHSMDFSNNKLEPSGMQSPEKKGIRSLLEGRRRKQEQKNIYREEMRRMINGYAVCEEIDYKGNVEKDTEQAEEFGKTIYIEEKSDPVRGLYTEKGELIVQIEKFPFVVGKRKEDADYVLSDYSASRVHARFVEEKDGIYLEDLNSTNGTFKNGLRMQPYEKRKLEPEDTLRFGKSTFVYK